ncbi:hypothetical protein F2Q70_00039092 [Brassica cretica]|uniref:Uncharacterized protein n=1 Tax=Brassica cretica TaxID=69181 RepID=A0A8S9KDF7_BRACR|nr:hypothetical protein F2Q70_00039092 [Brassica cretica]
MVMGWDRVRNDPFRLFVSSAFEVLTEVLACGMVCSRWKLDVIVCRKIEGKDFSKISLCSKKMSSRKGSSKRNSSSHSSSGDSSAIEVIAPKEEFEVEEEPKDAYYKALCGSPPPS